MDTPFKKSSIAKITRPTISGVIERSRLFKLLDEGVDKPITWICASAGSGKTTLIASYLEHGRSTGSPLPCLWYQVDEGDADLATFFYYMGLAAKKAAPRNKKHLPLLTPEYLQGIPAFTRRYFENLFIRLKPPFTLVLDNYQDAPGSAFHEMMSIALDVVPDGINVIILSRQEPPPQLVRLRANNKISLVGWNDIRFTKAESDNLLGIRGQQKPSEAALENLHIKTDGWAAGLVLMKESAALKGVLPYALTEHEQIFNYFAGEIFEKTDKTTQDVLLKTSFLNKIESAAAEKLTGIATAGQILGKLCRDQYFTQKHARGYQYHPLFLDFLQTRAKETFTSAELAHIQRSAAALLEESGQIEEAAKLFLDVADWIGAKRLLINHALVLVLQGRSKTLEDWILAVPEEVRSADGWLNYWLGICRMAFDPMEARLYVTKAFSLFRSQSNAPGQYLSWAAIIDTFVYAGGEFSLMDKWIDEFEKLSQHCPVIPSPEIEARVTAGMFNALFWRQPRHPELPMWAERLSCFVQGSADVSIRMALGNNLVFYFTSMGDLSKATLIINSLRTVGLHAKDSLSLMWWRCMEAMYSWFIADHAACLTAVSQGTALGKETGVHLMDFPMFGQGIISGSTLGDIEAAKDFLNRMGELNATRIVDKAVYHETASMVHWYMGNLSLAHEHAQRAVGLCEEAGWPFFEAMCRLVLAIILFDKNIHAEAWRELARSRELMQGLSHMEFLCDVFGAWFAFQQGDMSLCVKELRKALKTAAEQEYVNFIMWRPEMMSNLLAIALSNGIETEYVKMLIKKRNLVPLSDTPLQNWPYPVKIYARDGFEILIDGKPCKVQKKLQELLRAIIDLGGKDVREESLTDLLWPEAEGDMAHQSFATALKRLRTFLGDKEAVVLKSGRVTINRESCWVDVLAEK